MNVTVHFVGQVRTAAGGLATRAVVLEPEATLAQLVDRLCATHDPSLTRLLRNGENRLLPTVLVFLDDEQVDVNDARPLHDGDEVTFLTPIAGGGR